MRRRTFVVIAVAAVVVLAIGVGVWLLTRASGPEATARSYLDALAAGDGERAVGLLAEQPDGDVSLPKALAGADERLSDVAVVAVEEGEGRARASVSYTLAGAEQKASFDLVETAGSWRVAPDALGALTAQPTLGAFVLAGGAPVPAGSETALLPAVYPVEAAPAAILSGATTAAVLIGGVAEASVEASVSPDATAVAQQQLDRYAQRCAAPAQTVPENCGIRVPWAADLAALTSIAFRIEQTPQLVLGPDLRTFAATDGVIVATATGTTRDGADASFTYRADDWALRGTVTLTRDSMELAVG